MSAAYDTYDYPGYWIGRDYEHLSEIVAIGKLLAKVKKIKTILEIGSGFGRLVSSYAFRAKNIILSDPSARLLKIARITYKDKKNFKFIHASLENLPDKIRSNSIDLVVLVRVIHHLNDISQVFQIIHKLLSPRGYLLLEFANKANLKANLKNFLSGNFTFPLDIFTTDLRSKKSLKKKSLPFYNYHPHLVTEILTNQGFKIVEVRSVSNIRNTFLKKIFATEILLYFENLLQKILAPIYFGPSIFILARKRG